jgi:hypothetical protein
MVDAINKHLKMTPAKVMGHMNQRRQNIHSTSKESKLDMDNEVVTPINTGVKTDLAYAVVIDQGQLYIDLTGRFPMRSSKGSWYTMIVYSFYCTFVLAVPMKINSSTEWLTTYGDVYRKLTSRGFNAFYTSQYKTATKRRGMHSNPVAWGVGHGRSCAHSFELQLIFFKLPDTGRI